MCYTGIDSVNSYLINLVTCVLLYINATDEFKIISLFLFFVGQMQLFDAIFWNNITCNNINYIITKIASIFNHLQPILLFLLFYYFNFKTSNISNIILILYTICSLLYTINNWKDIKCTLPNKDGIMVWKWNNFPYSKIVYFLFLSYLTITSFNLKTTYIKYLFAIINLVSFYVATKTPILNASVGRIWCYYASLLPLLLLIPKYLKF